MYELIQVGDHTYYMDCPSKVGFFQIAAGEVVLIDSGSGKDAAKKVKRILDEKGWKLRAIFNTHSHADHIGGNQYLQSQTGCKIYAKGLERCFTEHTILEPTVLYSGYAAKDLRNKFLMAKESAAEELPVHAFVQTQEAPVSVQTRSANGPAACNVPHTSGQMASGILPEGLEVICLPGHSYDMVGFRTSDDVVFLADSLSSGETLEKYQICFLYDVRAYLETLEMVKGLDARCFVPSHAPQTDCIAPLAQLNIDKTEAVAATVCGLLARPRTFDDLLTEIFNTYHLTMNLVQNLLVGSTLKSYLAYLKEEGRVDYIFEDNRMLWQAV